MSKFIAISCDGTIETHATSGELMAGSYATLCGLDGDDPAPNVKQKIVPLHNRPKIDCAQCIAMIRHAKKYASHDLMWFQ